MTDKQIIVIILIGSIGLVVGGALLSAKLATPVSVTPSLAARAEVATTTKDWGNISVNQGKVETDFQIQSAGSEPLQLYNITTSCMCTTAQIIINGIASPSFTMGQRSSYVAQVPAGSTATLKVIFDPAYHGDNGLGPVTRLAEVATNDARAPKIRFSLSGLVIR